MSSRITTFRATFLCAHILSRENMRVAEYETLLAKLYATIPRHVLVECLLGLFVDYVGIFRLWASVSRTLHEIESARGDEGLQICRRLLREWREEPAWIPLIGLWNFFAPEASSCPEANEIGASIMRGDYAGAFARVDHMLSQSNEVEIFENELITFLRAQKIESRFDDILHWRHFRRAHIFHFAVFVAIMMFDPRSARMNHHAEQLSQDDIATLENPANELDMLRMTCYIASQTAWRIRDLAPGRDIEDIINRARDYIEHMNLADEQVLTRAIAQSPLFADEEVAVTSCPIKIIARLRANTFIGFDGLRRIIICGPMKEERARSCLNIARIAQELHVARENENPRFVYPHGAKHDKSAIFFVMETSMSAIPQKLLRPAEIMSQADANLRHKFIENCMWRFIMNFEGSASADILVTEGGRIFGYNEEEIGSGARTCAPVQRSVLVEFARDREIYEKIAATWACVLRKFALIECAACAKFPEREHRTSISHALLSQCTGRAVSLGDIWLSQLKKHVL